MTTTIYIHPAYTDQNREFNIGIRLLTSCIHQHFIKAMQ